MNDLELLSEMTDSVQTVGTGAVSPQQKWGSVSGVPQQREDRLPTEEADAKWNQIYQLFGAGSEGSRDEAYLAVTLYFLTNGCSPSGKYARLARTGGGISIPVDAVVKITGRLEGEIRQFLRSHMRKSYECLKYNAAVPRDISLADKAERLGVSRDKAWLLADWLRDCEFLTGDEARVHYDLSRKLISEANARRREPVVAKRVEEGNVAGGEAMAPIEPVGGSAW